MKVRLVPLGNSFAVCLGCGFGLCLLAVCVCLFGWNGWVTVQDLLCLCCGFAVVCIFVLCGCFCFGGCLVQLFQLCGFPDVLQDGSMYVRSVNIRNILGRKESN